MDFRRAHPAALIGLLAHEFGGRAGAVALSCAAAMSALVYLGLGNFYSMNVYEPLFWMGCIYLLVRIIDARSINHQSASGGSTINRSH